MELTRTLTKGVVKKTIRDTGHEVWLRDTRYSRFTQTSSFILKITFLRPQLITFKLSTEVKMSFPETAFPQARGHVKGRYQLSQHRGQSLDVTSASVSTELTFKYQKPNKDWVQPAGSGCWGWSHKHDVRAGISVRLLAFPFCLLPCGDVRAAVYSHVFPALEAESRGKQGLARTGSLVRFYRDSQSFPTIPSSSQWNNSQVPLTRTRSHGHTGYKEHSEVRARN